jgi:ADP-ribosylglycohydrolase
MGSFGNGAAMRISPLGLLFYKDHQSSGDLYQSVGTCSKITHSNQLGIRGAILQALAVKRVMNLEQPNDPLDVISFTDELIKEMATIEGVVSK